jgi:hypothetical protein
VLPTNRQNNVGWAVAARLLFIFVLSAVSCRSPRPRRPIAAARPANHSTLWRQPAAGLGERRFPAVQATIAGRTPKWSAMTSSATCHGRTSHQSNLHREQSCAACHPGQSARAAKAGDCASRQIGPE